LNYDFAPIVTLIQRYVSTKLEVSMAFRFRENPSHETDEQTDRVQHLLGPLDRNSVTFAQTSVTRCCRR